MSHLPFRALTGVLCLLFLLAGCGTSEAANTTVQNDLTQETVPEELAFAEEETIEEEAASIPETEEPAPEAQPAPPEDELSQAYSQECLDNAISSTSTSIYEDTYEDIFPAIDSCESVESLVAALAENNQDGRYDEIIGSPQMILSNLCNSSYYPEGPFESKICKDLAAQ